MKDQRTSTFLGATIPRRSVLAGSAAVAGLAVAGCSPTSERRIPNEQDVGAPQREPTPPDDLGPDEYVFFSQQEARAVEAAVARIIPGDEEDPGAIQAGVPFYIDRMLDMFEEFAEPTYHQGPFAVPVEEGEQPPSGPDVVPVPVAELYRYGFQSPMTPRQLYHEGLAGLDRLAQTRFGSLFADLDAATQDQVLLVLEGVQNRVGAGEESGSALSNQDEDSAEGGGGDVGNGGNGGGGNGGNGTEGGPTDEEMDQAEELFGEVDPGSFFSTVRMHTIEGMFSDPVYGGNRNLVGWTLVGWPGAQRSYSPQEMLNGTDKQPRSMEGLAPMNPDRFGPGREAIEKPKSGVHSH